MLAGKHASQFLLQRFAQFMPHTFANECDLLQRWSEYNQHIKTNAIGLLYGGGTMLNAQYAMWSMLRQLGTKQLNHKFT